MSAAAVRAPQTTSPAPPLGSDIRRLLIVCPTWVGDTVMATPVLRAARQALPDAQIIAATRPGLDELLRGCPWVNRILPISMTGLHGPITAARALRRLRPNAILLLPNSFRSALTARLGGAPLRIGYNRDGRGMLLTHRLTLPRRDLPTPTAQDYAALGRFALGRDLIDIHPELFVTAEEDAAADAALTGIDAPFIILHPGANKPAKRWPADRFARIADTLHASHGVVPVVSGTPAEATVLRHVIEAASHPIINLAERNVTLGALKAVIRRAALMITNDTGPRHIAAAVGTPLITLFGPTDSRWTALDGVEEAILRAEPFLPEDLIADRFAKLCSVDRIAVGDVLAAARTRLDAPPDSRR